MPCCARFDAAVRWLAGLWLGCWLAVAAGGALASDKSVVRQAVISATPQGYVLDADINIVLNHTLEDALNKGINLYFLLELELSRPRNWWFDEGIAEPVRKMRIYYHLLLRRYVVETGYTTHTAASLSEALALLGRVDDWQVLERGALKAGRRYDARLRLRLDTAQLPKPLSIGAVTGDKWELMTPWHDWSFDAPAAPPFPDAFALMRSLIAAALIVGIVLLALLFYASGDGAAFSDSLPTLFIGGGVLGVALMVLLGWRLWWLQKRIRRGVFGAKLTLKLLLLFGVVAMLPGLVVYGASVFFLNRSIETWFDVRVDNALASGVNLGQAALDDLLRDLDRKAQRMALSLSDEGMGSMITSLSTLREQSSVQELTLFDERGGVVAHVSGERGTLLPVLPDRGVLWQVRQQQPYSRIEEVADRGLILHVIVPVYTSALSGGTRVLQLVQPVPTRLARDAQAVQLAYQEYQQIAVSRLGLKRIYGVALTLTLMLALLMTLVIAYLLSERLGAPLRTLARGTRAVAKGDFSQMPSVSSRDELGVLIQSFNRMTRQLSDAREQVAQNHQQTEQAKAFLERVLANLSSGVVVLDEALRVRTMNSAAAHILGVGEAALDAQPLADLGQAGDEVLHAFGATVASRFSEHEGEWQEQIDYAGHGGSQSLLLRGTRLPPGVERGYVLVFDDVTKLIDAERNAAWSEVARRLAHEIKNPLTPIQLSAERIARKLGGRLEATDAEFLERATQTIVNQVAAMKSMVDAFAGYARMPRAKLEALDLNALVHEVLALYDAKALGLQLHLDADLPRIAGDSTLLRQVIHNLLQNAQDALIGHPSPRVEVSTRLRHNNLAVCLTVTDNGAGFPEHLMTRLFEPYATTKAKGTGLGLAIVKKIVEEHHGKIQIENLKSGGAAIRIALPVSVAVGEHT